MHYYEVAPTKIVRTDSATFTYVSVDELQVGQIVEIEVGKKHLIGLVIESVEQPKYPTKPMLSIVEEKPIPSPLVNLASWLSDYYQTPLATVLQTMLPSNPKTKRRTKEKIRNLEVRKRTNLLFTKEQSDVIKEMGKSGFGGYLLFGVTGSGKTQIYIEAARQAAAKGLSSIILVPEISLTPQLTSEFSAHFNHLIVTHSKMTEAERHLAWREALYAEEPTVVIGPRSALFLPISKIGLIVVDEAHEPSYKQDQSPKYSALRAASMLGRYHEAKVVFGSATPNITDRYLADASGRAVLRLTKTAVKNSRKPNIQLIDMKKRENFIRHRFISDSLLDSIDKSLSLNKQVLIFHNRRGSTSTTLCSNCGWTSECPNCLLPLSLHSDHHQMLCHICGYSAKVPTSCPVCKSADIIHKGVGTKLIESEIRRLYPKATIARFDSDNLKADTLEQNYEGVYKGDVDIIIGTQTVAKGLDLPGLRTVGVIQADSGLSLPDYTSTERTFQLLSQVIGRVGRFESETDVVIQTFKPDHPSITFGVNQDYEGFYEDAINDRKKANFPPFTYLLKLTCLYKSEAAAVKNSRELALSLKKKYRSSVQVLGPTPAFYEKQHGTYRWQIVVKSPKRETLKQAVRDVPSTHWQIDLDPTSLL